MNSNASGDSAVATVVLTKQSAAHRLLIAAIRMFERGDDPLATFVVASAAFSTLRELVKVKGDSYQLSILREALFSDAKRRTLDLPELLPQDPYLDQAIEKIAEGIRTGEIKGPEDVQLVLNKDVERALISHQTDHITSSSTLTVTLARAWRRGRSTRSASSWARWRRTVGCSPWRRCRQRWQRSCTSTA